MASFFFRIGLPLVARAGSNTHATSVEGPTNLATGEKGQLQSFEVDKFTFHCDQTSNHYLFILSWYKKDKLLQNSVLKDIL